MEGFKKNEVHNTANNPFARFHKRVHDKYLEMQKRLHKSRSVDSLANLSDDFVTKSCKHSSTIDVRKSEVFTERKSEKIIVKHNVIVEDINRHDVTFLEVNESEAVARVGTTENIFFGDDISSSFESLSEELWEDKGIEEVLTNLTPSPSPVSTSSKNHNAPSTTPPARISIREKIERIRRERKDKKEEKKRESTESFDKKQFLLSTNTTGKLKKPENPKKKQKLASVAVALIEATGLENEVVSDEKSRLFYCRLRLGTEKRKTKTVKSKDNAVSFQELFHFGLFDDNTLEVYLYDKDSVLGKTVVDLSTLENEKTHRLRLKFEGTENVQLFILLTISGVTPVNTFVDLDDYEQTQRIFEALKRKYSMLSVYKDMSDVGWASVIVYGAKGLCTNDTYCVLELDNDRRQTHTEYKTNDPNWMKIMEFNVKDVTSILVVTVCDDKKNEAIGRICIPLLKINNREKKWYALKDKENIKERAKGHNPRILIEIKMFYNVVKASLRVINPKEADLLETEREFSRQVFGQNVARAKAVIKWIFGSFKFLKECFEWESRMSNVKALTIWIAFWWFYKAWMMPLLLLIPFIMYRPPEYYLIKSIGEKALVKIEDPEENKEEKSMSLKEKINSLQELIQTVQNGIGKFAEFGEHAKNLCNFTVPFLSFLAIFIILLIAFVIYLVPVPYILMVWGIHKFLRKILRPNRIPNNEILDLLSRVPDDETLVACEELPLLELAEEDQIK